MRIPAERNVRSKTQEEIYRGESIDYSHLKNSAYPLTRENDAIKNIKVDLYDIDRAILWYIENKMNPYVIGSGGNVIKVPCIYGSPEIWRTVSVDGYYRDPMGKLQLPLIMVRRTNIEENGELQLDKLDANEPNLYYQFVSEKASAELNKYRDYEKLLDENPIKAVFAVGVPMYVNISYEVTLWTDFVQQINKLIELFLYHHKAYWGERERYKFLTLINGFSSVVEIVEGDDRMVRSSGNLMVKGYLMPELMAKDIAQKAVGLKKMSTIRKIVFEKEIEL